MKIKVLLTIPMLCTLFGCSSNDNNNIYNSDYVSENLLEIENTDPKNNGLDNDFLTALAINYRSFALYNHYNLGHEANADLFATKALNANSGETVFPEDLKNWPIPEDRVEELSSACATLTQILKDGAYEYSPILTARAQTQFDCWVSMETLKCDASNACAPTLQDCKNTFYKTINQIKKPVQDETETDDCVDLECSEETEECTEEVAIPVKVEPLTKSMTQQTVEKTKDGITIINNINFPEGIIQAFKQKMDCPRKCSEGCPAKCEESKTLNCPDLKCPEMDCPKLDCPETDVSNLATKDDVNNVLMAVKDIKPADTSDYVTRDEFTSMMKEIKGELSTINGKLDTLLEKEPVQLAVGAIPEDPKQHVMEEVLEINFDFNKAVILPEYVPLIRKLASITNENKNMKVSIIGYTDTVGSSDYNWALGGRRANNIKQELIKYGIAEDQITITSAGKNQNKIDLGNNKASKQNRRAQIVKEVYSIDNPEIVKPATKTPVIKELEYKSEVIEPVKYETKTIEPEIMTELETITE